MERIKNAVVNFYKTSLLLRPLRLVVIAYGYVLRGEKVQPNERLNWNEI